ncbi:MAG TPA: hypothetical protein VNJ07_02065, partial [Chitinophagales bacterium]|nr:hypothetical protein [Chitinophagales bacterium]
SEIILLEVFFEDDLAAILTSLVIFYLLLFIMRMVGVLKKRNCPSCSGKLSRKPRTLFDKLLVVLTLNILPLRRYKCIHCGWEGLRWSGKKYKTRDVY